MKSEATIFMVSESGFALRTTFVLEEGGNERQRAEGDSGTGGPRAGCLSMGLKAQKQI